MAKKEKTEKFRCGCCKQLVPMHEAHKIDVKQINRPLKKPDAVFILNTYVLICNVCFRRYGGR